MSQKNFCKAANLFSRNRTPSLPYLPRREALLKHFTENYKF